MHKDGLFHLPLQLSSFIGRDAAASDVARLVRGDSGGSRLVTLTGPGGVGKTRLALRVAASIADSYPDGVWLVELAPLARPSLVLQTIADQFGVREEQDRSLSATLASYLGTRRLLLILDNCEHLAEACANLVEQLLSAAPELHILATSREPLAIHGEMAWRVPPLTVAYPDHLPNLDEVGRCDAVRLFVDRARGVLPRFELNAENVRAVAEICYRLDGVPLAIELAAARVSVLSPEQIAKRLDDRFALLTAGRRTAVPRQQTLRATIDWSYGLISLAERRLFHRLGVFAGGFTLEAIEWISETADADGVGGGLPIHELGALVDKSLVVAEHEGGRVVRYRLLETLREYAREQLAASGEVDAVERRHALFYRDLAERAEPELKGSRQLEWFENLVREYPNLRAALRWAIGKGEAETALRIGGALQWFWEMRGHHTEGRRWLGEMLSLPGAGAWTKWRAKALSGLCFLTWVQGELGVARTYAEESLAIARQIGDDSDAAWALSCMGNVARSEANYAAAGSLYGESLALWREANHRWGMANSLFLLGTIAYFQGDYARARERFDESLAIGRAIGDRWTIASSLGDLGDVAYREGKFQLARALSEESINVARQLGIARLVAWRYFNLGRIALAQGDLADSRRFFHQSLTALREPGDLLRIAVVLEGLAGLAAAREQPDRAFRLVGAANGIRERIGAPFSPGDRKDLDRWLQLAGLAHDNEVRVARRVEGRAMTVDHAIEFALSDDVVTTQSQTRSSQTPPERTPPAVSLSPREVEVASLVAQGCTNREIAERLVISEGTARVHVTHILDRLGLRSRAQVAAWAVENGLLAAHPSTDLHPR